MNSDLLARLRAALGDRYSVERELASGGMAAVYLAKDLRHDRRVAVKVLHAHLAAAVSAERFHREIETVAALNHPHILPLYNSGEADGFLYYVMPFAEGESLRDRLNREGQLPIPEALQIAREIADALSYAHRRSVIHRDIKPGNILLSGKHAVLSDFGISLVASPVGEKPLTAAGVTLGTPSYMSPEQGAGEQLDARSDIYSLGCVLYEMLAGTAPFSGASPLAILSRQLTEDPPDLTTLRPSTPEWVVEVVRAAMAKSPADRFQNTGVLRDALADPSVAERFRRLARASLRVRWKRWFVGWHRVALVALVFLVLGTAGVVISQGGLEPGSAIANPRGSYVVMSFPGRVQTPEEELLAAQLGDQLTSQLRGWKEMRVVQPYQVPGLGWGSGLATGSPASLADGLKFAKAAGVGTLVALEVQVMGDSAYVTAKLFDVPTGRSLRAAALNSGQKRNGHDLVEPLALELLQLGGAPASVGPLEQQTDVLQAVQEVVEGLRYLYAWELTDAEASFRAAIAEDSLYALAQYYLAVTLYWQMARDVYRLEELEPEIEKHLAVALQESSGLPWRDSVLIQAFFDSQGEEFDRARAGYRALLARDSTDIDAWLFLGSVEYRDPRLKETSAGELTPRGNLNLAVHAFDRTVELNPSFRLGYGHLFDIYASLVNSTMSGYCIAFERPGVNRRPSEPRQAVDQLGFCPAIVDSIGWIPTDSLSTIDRGRAVDGAERLHRDAVRRIDQWQRFAPQEAAPHAVLAEWYQTQRSSFWNSLEGSELRALSWQALEELELALALTPDTLPEDLVRLGALSLVVGEVGTALRLTDSGVAQIRAGQGNDALVPGAAAAVYLALGQPRRALDIAAPIWAVGSMATRDVTGQDVDFGDAIKPAFALIRMYGATGRWTVDLDSAFDRLHSHWSGPRYTESAAEALFRAATPYAGPALILSERRLSEWTTRMAKDHPLTDGFLAVRSDTSAARAHLNRAVALANERESGPHPGTAYLIGTLAAELGEDSLAIEMFDRVTMTPLRIFVDPNTIWGLRSLAFLHRAKAHEALGDTARAIEDYDTFLEHWAEAEPLLRPVVIEAEQARDRLHR